MGGAILRRQRLMDAVGLERSGEIGTRIGLPIVENPPLARALHATVVETDGGDPARATTAVRQ